MKLILNDNTAMGDGCPPYITAEVNSSHGGDVETARRMIDAAADCGCDCVKFQSWTTDSLYAKSYYDGNPIAKRFVKKFSLDDGVLKDLAAYCRDRGVAFSSTPYSRREVDFLLDACQAPYIKIASMDLVNYPFLAYIARTGAPMVLSTGMGSSEEIARAVETVEKAGCTKLCLLHCISIYPPDIATVHLMNIVGLQKAYPAYPVGFSDHSAGTELAVGAVALGACMIEKHLTLDKTRIGMDNQMAMEPDEMKNLVRQCRNVYSALGGTERVVLEAELEQRKKMRRSIVFSRDMAAGETIREGDLDVKRPGTGIAPEFLPTYIGRKLKRDVSADAFLTEADTEGPASAGTL